MLYNYDFRYTLAKIPVNTTLRLNFRKLVFIGKKENVSKNRPIIFAPNHRNALLDALMLVYASYHSKQVVFLARADIFGKKFVAWLLRGLRIMPVFRIRDGKDNLDKNNEIFDNAARILKKNNPIALFPEAKHNPKQSLLPIQKAVPRIVLPTEASVDFRLRSQIVPVAIYYRDISAFLSDAYVTFGTPIEVADYRELYNENPVLAVNRLRRDMEQSLKSIVVNIRNDAFYNEYCLAIGWNGDRIAAEMFPEKKDGFLQAVHYIVRRLDEMYAGDRDGFNQKTAGFRKASGILKEHGLTPKDRLWNPYRRFKGRSRESFSDSGERLRKPFSALNLFVRFTALALSAPMAFLGFLNGIIPVLLNKKLMGLFKDNQFIASARYASGLFFVPIFDLIQSTIVGAVSGNWLPALGYFLLMPPIFYFALYWRKWSKTALRDRKVRRFAKHSPEEWEQVQRLIRL